MINSIATSVPTNAASGFTFDVPTAWNDILNDPNFHLATNHNTGAMVLAPCAANGGWSYPGTFPVRGTSPGAYNVYAIGWDKSYATPHAAAAAGAAVGWSSHFPYAFVIEIAIPPDFRALLSPFGVIPEPSTASVAALGALTIVIFRRRNAEG